MNKLMRKITVCLISVLLSVCLSVEAFAASNVTYPSDVTSDMIDSDFWKKLSDDSDEVLMSVKEINKFNKMLEKNSDLTNIVNLEEVGYVGYGSFEKISSEVFIDGKKIDQNEYIATFKKEHRRYLENKYAVAVKREVLKIWPIDKFLGDSATDPDDENALAVINPNEPFVIGGKTKYNGKTYYYGRSDNCSGWVSADSVAICKSKEEWLDAWKVKVSGKNFIVVTGDTVVLDSYINDESISKIELPMGTVLKLVPKSEMPETVLERGTWFNYVV